MANLEKLKNQILNKHKQELKKFDGTIAALIKSKIYKKCLKSNIDLCNHINFINGYYNIEYSVEDILCNVNNLSVNFNIFSSARHLYLIISDSLLPRNLAKCITWNTKPILIHFFNKTPINKNFNKIWSNMANESKVNLIKIINAIDSKVVLKNIYDQFPEDIKALLVLT